MSEVWLRGWSFLNWRVTADKRVGLGGQDVSFLKVMKNLRKGWAALLQEALGRCGEDTEKSA